MNRNTRKPSVPPTLTAWCALTLLLCCLAAPPGAPAASPAKVGTYHPSQGVFLLDANGNFTYDGTPPDLYFPWAPANFIPVVGDWNGSGTK
jgi:hypothetical protein